MRNSKQANLCRHLLAAATNTPQALAVAVQKKKFNKFVYQEINFARLNTYSDQIAYALTQHGLKSGDKAVLMVTPSIDFFALTFALFKAGIIPILVDPGMGIKNLKQCFIDAQPDVFIAIPKAHLARRLFSWGKKSLKHNITVAGSSFWGISLKRLLKKYSTQQAYPMVKLAPEQMAAILFTSGSTGAPKGVIYSHAMFEAQIEVLKKEYGIQSGERDLATFPLFSLFGPALGMASIVPDMDASNPIKTKPQNVFAAIEQYQCTNLFANPALIDLLGGAGLKKGVKLKSIKRVISAGAPVIFSAMKNFTKLLNHGVLVENSYGATESLPISKISNEQLLRTETITDTGGGICVGLPVCGIEVAIIKITDDIISKWDKKLKLANYEIGEIVVKGPQVSAAYLYNEQATQAAKISDVDGFRHRMGDLGYLDELGKLWMCGRKTHAVNSIYNEQDKSYYSVSCERIFNTHPAVKRSALVAVIKNNVIMPVLCIELTHKSTSNNLKLFNELRFIADRHPQTQGIKTFLIHPNFPMDIRHNAKIFREKLAIWAQQKIAK